MKTIDVHSNRAASGLLALAVLFVLYIAQTIIIPIVLACFLNLLLSPAVRGLRRRARVPAAIGAALVLCVFVTSIGYSAYRLSGPTRSWLDRLPAQWHNIERKIRRVKQPLEDIQAVGREVEKVTKLDDDTRATKRRARQMVLPPAESTFVRSLIAQGWLVTVMLVVTLLLAYLTLASGETLLQNVVRAMPRLEQKKRAVSVVRTIETHISRYLVTVTAINALLGGAVGLAVWAAGLPNPALWGTVAGALNFIPYGGAVVGIVLVGLASLLTFESTWRIALPPTLYLGLTALEGYVLTPSVLGHRLALEPVVVFVAVLFWGWMWGVAGAFLAVPILIMVKIVCDNVAAWRWLGMLLGPLPDDPAPPPESAGA